jgi:hypothetical protein
LRELFAFRDYLILHAVTVFTPRLFEAIVVIYVATTIAALLIGSTCYIDVFAAFDTSTCFLITGQTIFIAFWFSCLTMSWTSALIAPFNTIAEQTIVALFIISALTKNSSIGTVALAFTIWFNGNS